LINEAKKKGFHYYSRNPSPKFFSAQFVDGGLLVLSKFPIVAEEFIVYDQGIQSDALAAKGVLYTKIQLRNGMASNGDREKDKNSAGGMNGKGLQLHLFNTHMQASYNSVKNLQQKDRYEAIRTSQLKNLREFVFEKTKGDSFPIVLLGDFNVNGRKGQFNGSDSEEYLHMLDQINIPCFELNDLLKEHTGFHPVTVGDVEIIDGTHSPKEVHLTKPEDQKLCKRLDYIFWLKRLDLPHDLQTQLLQQQKRQSEQDESEFILEVKQNSCRVEHLYVNEKESRKIPFTQLSDHYGISAEFLLVKSNQQTEKVQI